MYLPLLLLCVGLSLVTSIRGHAQIEIKANPDTTGTETPSSVPAGNTQLSPPKGYNSIIRNKSCRG